MEWLMALVLGNPAAAAALSAIGVARLVFKPLCSAVQAYVDKTETKDDDLWWSDLKGAKWFTTLIYILDATASIKLPTGK